MFGARISAGRCVASMTFAIVKVLPRAGDAEQHLRALAGVADARHQLVDRLRLVALRLEVGDDAERHAALALLRPRRTVRHPGLVAELRPALLDQLRQRLHRRGDRRLRQRLGVLQRHVEAGDRHQPGAGALARRGAAAHRRAARGLQRLFLWRGLPSAFAGKLD